MCSTHDTRESPESSGPWIALESRLRHCPRITTLGVRPNFMDYSPDERQLICRAAKIYYPSSFYADLLDTLGIRTFPSYNTYKFAQDKIKQTALFQMAGIPHPSTHVFYGPHQKEAIIGTFELPLIAKIPRGSALGSGVFLIRTPEELNHYCQKVSPAYIQEYLPVERDIRVVTIGGKAIHSYWRIAPFGDHRCNVARGADIDLSPVPPAAIELAETTARICSWDDVGLDICRHRGGFYVLEANMKYGRQGFRRAGIDYFKLMEQLITNGEI